MRPIRVRLPALLLAGLALTGVLTQASVPAGAAGGSRTTETPIPAKDPAGQVRQAKAMVAALDQLVEQTRRELEVGTAKLEKAQARSAAVRAQADKTREEADAAVADSAVARAELSRVVLRNFMSPPPSTLSTVLSTGKEGLSDAVLAAHDRDVLEGNQRDLLRQADASRVKASSLVVSAEQLEAQAAREAQNAAAQEKALSAQAAASQVKLAKAFAELEKANAAKAAYDAEQARIAEEKRQAALAAAARRKAAAEAAAESARNRQRTYRYTNYIPSDDGGAACTGASTDGYPNGFIPSSALCSIGGGHRLRADAARAFLAMSKAYGGLCVTDSYRSYSAQVDVYRRKPTLAAIPGNSNHGLGIAIDFCGGIERFGSSAHAWMDANAGRFGWVHPSWARQGGSKPEAWHWEFRG